MINRDLIDLEIKRVLGTELRLQVGLSDVPSATPTVPYLILEWSPSPAPLGSMEDPQDMPYFDYLVKSVGRDHRETARTASRANSVMVGRYTGGQWLCDFEVEGVTFVSRLLISGGMVVKANGPNLFEVNDIYRICVSGSTPTP